MAKKRNKHITDEDLFGSIPRPLDINPFEGIDIDEISAQVPKKKRKVPSKDMLDNIDHDIQPLNSLEGIDLDLISADPSKPKQPSRAKAKPKPFQPINPIEGIDLGHVAVSPTEAAASQLVAKGKDPRAKIPKILRGRKDSRKSKPLIVSKLKSSFKYTEIQRLRESIIKTAAEYGSKTVAFVSPHDGVGSTFLAATIGLNAAVYCGLKVLIMDLNMRRPELHSGFGLPREDGFGDIIRGDIRWKAVIRTTELENLHIVTAGSPIQDLATFLDQEFLMGMIEDLKMVYDLVICDTSPLLIQNRNNVDPGLVGSICDLTVLIIQNNKTTKTQLRNAVTAIRKGGGQLSGVIMNE